MESSAVKRPNSIFKVSPSLILKVLLVSAGPQKPLFNKKGLNFKQAAVLGLSLSKFI